MSFGMPVAIGDGDGGELGALAGVVTTGGLISSTLLTSVFVPVVFSRVERAWAFTRRLGSETNPRQPTSNGLAMLENPSRSTP